jgi:DNA-binding MarR family transcriptional regulator
MAKIDPSKLWSLNYRLIMSVIIEVAPEVAALDLEVKEVFVLSAIDELAFPAEVASALCMPKPTVTVNVKRLEAAGFVRREIDPGDLRRHRLLLTPAGRKAMTQGLALVSRAFGARLGRLTAAQQAELRGLLEKMSG